ncbi:Negative regulator of genetic competence ClpC/MecB [bioreactor metagenome]|uniref:Negative regulator of genetic competence ClpC/MecB n=1 Tax=bioreactor metagenome TaxID=1076179 RepID=A0A645DCB3_9ZZZZ
MLQVLDDGHITDGQGRKVDFKNTVIIMTSNAGAKNIIAPKKLGFTADNSAGKSYETMKDTVMEEVKQLFKPEFINRIDDIIVFHPLNEENVKQIVSLMTKEIINRVKENMDIVINFTDEAISLLAKEGFDPAYGARPLRRELQSKVEDEFAEEFLRNSIKGGDCVTVGVEDGKFVFNRDRS